jgi:hypothetical protein
MLEGGVVTCLPSCESAPGTKPGAGKYRTVATVEAVSRELHRDDHVVRRGCAVEFGQWFFFPAIEPALAFGWPWTALISNDAGTGTVLHTVI